MTAPVFLDTNLLVYLFANEDPGRQQVAEALYLQTAAEGSTVISTQVLQEFAEHHVVLVTPRMVLQAASRSASEQLSIWDALIVEAALAGGCRTLYSADFQHGRAFGPLRVVDPFRGG